MRVFALPNCVATAVVATALLGLAAPAWADITYTNFEVANDVNVTLTCISVANCTTGYYGSGQIDLYNNSYPNPVAEIWCVDVTHDLQGPWSNGPGGANTFNVTAWQDEGGGLSNIWSGGAVNLGTQLSNHIVGEIGALAYYGDTNISSYYVSSAVQLAIWDIEYNGGALNLAGALKEVSDDPQTQSLAEILVGEVQKGLLGADTDVDWLTCGTETNACNQGQIEVMGPLNPVPEPSTLALLGSALIGLAGFLSLRVRRA